MNSREETKTVQPSQSRPLPGLAGWLLGRLRGETRTKPRLSLVDRITLAPRQTLALVEAEGRRFLVATSPEGAPCFYALDEPGKIPGNGRRAARITGDCAARVSW
jgi:flagellar biogenesis protein FliO